jgi:hypothetical protein
MLLVAIILGGHLAAPAIKDPASVHRPWTYAVAALASLTIFGATATLTTLGYCLAFFRDVQAGRDFFKWVANYAGFGAVLGTLLGCRAAASLAGGRHPVAFTEFLGVIGNAATMLTLLMIAICWWRLWGVVRTIAHSTAGNSPTSQLRWLWSRSTFVVSFAGNLAGIHAAYGVWHILMR